MRLLPRSPETPSLETWLGRDVPHERELAGELLDQMGREKSLTALLALHDKEETKRIKQRRSLLGTQFVMLGFAGLTWLSALPWPHLMHMTFATVICVTLTTISSLIGIGATTFGFGQSFKASQRQKNLITALFDYTDSPLTADPLCRAIAYYDGKDRLSVFTNLTHVFPLLPNDKEALTKDARRQLIGRLQVLDGCYGVEDSSEQSERVIFADFEIAVLRYFARTRDRSALSAIRKLAKAKPFSADGRRVQDAARAALQAFSEPTE